MLCYLIYVQNMKIHFITTCVPNSNLNYIAQVNFAASTNYSTRTIFSGQRLKTIPEIIEWLKCNIEERQEVHVS